MAAAGLVPLGAIVMLVALVAAPGSWLTGYVSEAAVPGLPFAADYRWGFALVACGVAALGVALAPVVRWIGAVLGAAAVFAVTSAAVPCTPGCPLPPYEKISATDLVHGGASILGLVVLAGAMFLTYLAKPPKPASAPKTASAAKTASAPKAASTEKAASAAKAAKASWRANATEGANAVGLVQRRMAAVSVSLIVPVGAALGLTMLIAGRHPLGAGLERIALVIAVSWLTGAALVASVSRPPVRGRPSRHDHATVEA